MMTKATNPFDRVIGALDTAGDWAGLLLVRLLLAYEFGKAGFGKIAADGVPDWFRGVRSDFPFPFDVLPAGFSWFLASWTEVLGGIGLALGLFTRFWAAGLMILTIVAIFGVHWPEDWSTLAELWKGYAVTDTGFGNYRIPLLFFAMLLPLFLMGPGRLSADELIKHIRSRKAA